MFRLIISLSHVQILFGLSVLFAGFAPVDAQSLTLVGCYSGSGSLVFNETYKYQSSSWCLDYCAPMSNAVLGLTNGADCWCGNAIPSNKVDSSYCNVPCFGFGQDDCGGYGGYFTVYLTGVGTLQNPNALSESSASSSQSSTSTAASSSSLSSEGTSTSSAQSSSTASSSTTTSSSQPETTSFVTAGVTVTTTIPASHSSTGDGAASSATAGSSSANSGSNNNSSSSHGLSGGGIAGVVIGVVGGLAIIAAAVFFYIRYRRRHDDDDDWAGYHGGKGKSRGLGGGSANVNPMVAPPMPHEKLSSNSFNSGRVAIVDQRLNPVMMERRLSDGSLSDEQDYSRKILRVVNID
ncbi:hypothetical protein V1525DRAFT_424581 [Lipomyces kononenkoae]|uniref:Uncharacterized protein n=1 Tax=Lipomyces kononenkoae TaxID=34357 RepID=A0ACC3T6P4_LIPKO